MEAGWAAYEKQNLPSGPVLVKKSTSGRDEKKGWREVFVIIGAYIVKHYEITSEQIKIEEASKKIHEIAKAQGIAGLPEAPTIRGELSKIRAKAETLSIK